MSTTPDIPKPKGGAFLRKKVGGVPVIYIAAGATVILVIVAYKMNSSSGASNGPADTGAPDSSGATDEADAASPSGSYSGSPGLTGATGSALPNLPQGTVVVAPQQPAVEDAPYEDNSTWLRKATTYLISKGKNPGEVQVALQTYLAGSNLTYEQGQMRDMAVKEFGLPPDDFTAGSTAAKPPEPSTAPKPSPVPTPKPTPKPAPKPTPTPVVVKPRPTPPPPKPAPPKVRTHIVRSGDNLTKIAGQYHVKGGWQAIYAANRKTIGSNPNLIKPGQRLVIP